jgi:hypothetical protein
MGLQHGPFRAYSPSGILRKSGRFQDGVLEGEWIRRYDTGHAQDLGHWEKGIPTGLWEFYRIDGSLEQEGYFWKGEPICVWKHYEPDGGEKELLKSTPKDSSCEAQVPFDFREKPEGFQNLYQANRAPIRWIRPFANLSLISQASGGATNTFFYGLIPQGKVSRTWDWIAAGSLGFIRTRTSAGASLGLIMALEGGVRNYLRSPTPKLFFEATLGLQTWANSGTYFAPRIGIGFDPGLKGALLKASIQEAFLPGNRTTLVHLGVEAGWDTIQSLFRKEAP